MPEDTLKDIIIDNNKQKYQRKRSKLQNSSAPKFHHHIFQVFHPNGFWPLQARHEGRRWRRRPPRLRQGRAAAAATAATPRPGGTRHAPRRGRRKPTARDSHGGQNEKRTSMAHDETQKHCNRESFQTAFLHDENDFGDCSWPCIRKIKNMENSLLQIIRCK